MTCHSGMIIFLSVQGGLKKLDHYLKFITPVYDDDVAFGTGIFSTV